jgi:hypothetical protein
MLLNAGACAILLLCRLTSNTIYAELGEMQSYLQHAFDHFSQTLDEAFDFVRASLSNSPIPLDFGGNILRLALNVMDYRVQTKQRVEARELFQELGRMVASCIMLE